MNGVALKQMMDIGLLALVQAQTVPSDLACIEKRPAACAVHPPRRPHRQRPLGPPPVK